MTWQNSKTASRYAKFRLCALCVPKQPTLKCAYGCRWLDMSLIRKLLFITPVLNFAMCAWYVASFPLISPWFYPTLVKWSVCLSVVVIIAHNRPLNLDFYFVVRKHSIILYITADTQTWCNTQQLLLHHSKQDSCQQKTCRQMMSNMNPTKC